MQCSGESDTAEHTLFECEEWQPFREQLRSKLGHRPTVFDVQGLMCGPAFESLPADEEDKRAVLSEAEEIFRLWYLMVEQIMEAKEGQERARQAEEAEAARAIEEN